MTAPDSVLDALTDLATPAGERVEVFAHGQEKPVASFPTYPIRRGRDPLDLGWTDALHDAVGVDTDDQGDDL